MSTHKTDAQRFGVWLAEQLEARGYDLGPRGGGRTRFAEDAGVSPQALGRWLRGIERPATTAIEQIARRLGVPIAPLLAICGYIDPDELPARGDRTITQREALEALGVTNPAHQQAVLTMISALTGGANTS
ncbi:helix-turn-helix domain-containing protein [Streptomyces sp. NPDC002514]|uniref:helix-turn-helix domain-containing protein n=1 Tax=unclassified Streptomyces TaxID=2593676 RepID=UPI0036BC4EEA